MVDTFLSNLFNAVSEGQVTPEVNNTNIFSERIPMDSIILKFNFSYEYKAGKQLCFKLMVKERPLAFKGRFHSSLVLNVSSSCGIPVYCLK